MEIIAIDPEQYVHIGLKAGLDKILEHESNYPKVLHLDFNIDGVPLAKSSNSSFWLIQARIYYLSERQIFVVGMYILWKQ